MDRPRSTPSTVIKTLHPCSPSGVPTPLPVSTPQGVKRSQLTPSLFEGELSLSKLERLSPNQRTPTTYLETGTPRLVAAVSEAKRSGATAPSPSYGSDVPMDQFDRLLAKNIKMGNTPSQTPLSAREDMTGSPSTVSRAVHSVIADENKRRELLIGLQKLFQDAKAMVPPAIGGKNNSRNGTPRHPTPPVQQQQDAAVLASLGTLAKVARDVSPLHSTTPQHSREWPSGADPTVFADKLQQETGICRPLPTQRMEARLFNEALAQRQVPTSQKIIKSEMSAFSETTEASSFTSYSTNKSGNQSRKAANAVLARSR